MRELSAAHLALLGRVVVECAALEAEMYGAIGRILGLDAEASLMVTRRIAPDGRSDILRKLAVRYLEWDAAKEFIDLLSVIEAHLAARDFLVHAEWDMPRQGLLSASARTPSGYKSDSFTPARLSILVEATIESRTQFAAWTARITRRPFAPR